MDKSSSKRHSGAAKPTPNKPARPQSSPEKTASKSKKLKSKSVADDKSAADPVRLHIAPLTAESAKTIISPNHLSTASFHTIDTFPERSYGFITMPRVEAEKLRRKYNGTVFRGVKMSVEEARPAKKKVESDESSEGSSKKSSGKKEKLGRQDGVLPGFEIPDGRQVKRGWTKDASQKGGKSKDKPSAGASECLFKTILPPVIASEAKTLGLTEDRSSKKTKKRTVKNQVVIKEFKNSTKFPSFLKMSSLPTDSTDRSANYVEGLGWVNEAGDVIEGAPAKRRRTDPEEIMSKEKGKNEGQSPSDSSEDGNMEDVSQNADSSDESNESSSSSSESEDDPNEGSEDESVENENTSSESALVRESSEADSSSEASSSDSSVSSTSDDNSESEAEPEPESEADSEKELEGLPSSTPVPSRELPIKKTSSNFENLTNIFKPKLSVDVEATSQFKFFGTDFDDEEANEAEENRDDGEPISSFNDSISYTPFTPQHERYRSGAPTPDTAIAPRFKDLLPLPRDFDISIERDYFPTLNKSNTGLSSQKTPNGIKLLFPHTYSDRLHNISIWSSINLPKILTTGQLPEKSQPPEQATDGAVEVKDMTKVEKRVEDHIFPPPKPSFTPQRNDITNEELHKPKTGAGSSIVGWAGKKKTFNDEDEDFDMVDATSLAPPKAKTGAGSGVTGWAGKKKTFDDDGDDDITMPQVAPAETMKAKTGAGSGVTGWAGTKKTFADDDDDDNIGDLVNDTLEPTPSRKVAKASKTKVEKESEDEASEGPLSVTQAWEKVFYENRGEWNRQWKRKKREVAKAKRKREKVKRGLTMVS
ncbi:hypothetical protein TWF694_008745 [Orbilia ellipsospora]|uniref:Uncharacterized protein n=1 Tax=Orbilia ellipsospora TaxID=2528407 RepID=A0AAV9XDV5_9PEZI